MKICEIRDLDGPNLFLWKPAIKLELEAEEGAIQVSRAASELAAGEPVSVAELEPAEPERLMVLVVEVVNRLHDLCDQPRPDVAYRRMEEEGHYAVAYSWWHRRFAMALAKLALQFILGETRDIDNGVASLKQILASPPEDDDAPQMVASRDRKTPIIAITGTNGKTTTSRLISFILRHAGKKVGMTSSAGVYIDTEPVLQGDYSGLGGARRVLESDVDVAVLETARGGMLLRGLGYEECDVSVVTNVSADHLGLHGVLTVEGLAEVKSLVPRATREGGYAVLNADDPFVFAMREQIRARPFFISRRAISPEVRQHIENGGWALTLDDGQVHWWHDGTSDVVTSLNGIPITFGGRAPHMVENALCAAAGCLGLGLGIDQVRTGLAEFRSSSRDNHGRLNVYKLNGATVVIDFAHNEAGLRQLLEFAGHFRTGEGKMTAIVGTAGDRDEEAFRAIGRHAALQADHVIKKDTTKYLRGRQPGDMLRLLQRGIDDAGTDVPVEDAPSEREACLRAFERVQSGDVIAVMCVEDYDFLLGYLDERGTPVN
ncbi:MAG TPA: Mur ligase family protein [Thermomicrobiales bacterium]|nr:Mur ligase family protein [Thermomicrobiales bacterium]